MKINLKELVDYHDFQIRSRSLSKKLETNQAITLYAMAKGESISKETSPQTKLIQVLEGELEVTFADGSKEVLQAFDVLSITAKTEHSLLATKDCKMLQIELA